MSTQPRAPALAALALVACAVPPHPEAVPQAPLSDAVPPAMSQRESAAPAQRRAGPADVKGELEIVFDVPAWDAVLAAGRVVVLDPGAKTVSGYALDGGRRLWRTAVQDDPYGRQTLRVHGGSVLLWGGNRMHRLDAQTGARAAVEDVPWKDGCDLVEDRGTCAYQCACSLQLADCQSGRRVGPMYEKTYTEMFGPPGEPPSAGCFGSGVGLIAGAGRIAVISVEDESTPAGGGFSRDLVMLGVDAATGRQRWRSVDLGRVGGYFSGAAPDGGVCWVGDRDGELSVFECATGAVLWRRAAPAGGGSRHLLRWERERGALFRLADDGATLHRARTGAPLWKAAVPAGAFALPVGAPVGLYEVTADHGPVELLLLAPRDGAVAGRAPMPNDAIAHDDPTGGFYVRTQNGLVAHDPDGRERGRAGPPIPPNPVIGRDFVGLFDRERLVMLDRRDLRRIGEVRGLWSVQPGSALAGRMLLYRSVDQGQSPGQAILLRRRGS